MKLEELRFKTICPDMETLLKLYKKVGGQFDHILVGTNRVMLFFDGVYGRTIIATDEVTEFPNSELPYMDYKYLLKLKIEKPDPEFPFKILDNIIGRNRNERNHGGDKWRLCRFARTVEYKFMTDRNTYNEIAALAGNEHLIGETIEPKEYWKVCGTVPYLIRK